MKNEKLIKVPRYDYSRLSDEERKELYVLTIMGHSRSKSSSADEMRLSKRERKRFKELHSKVLVGTDYLTQEQYEAELSDEDLPF